jgi:CTP synthase (UTP-ammonia lyase)
MDPVRIGLIGDYDPTVTAHRAIGAALEQASARLGRRVEGVWPGTEAVEREGAALLSGFDGLWCVPASPYRSMEGALAAIRFARESPRPFLGTCGGFQHALIEYARHVLDIADADHAETSPDAALPLVSRLACSLVEATGSVHLRAGSRAAAVAGDTPLTERYHCNFGLNPEHRRLFEGSGLRIVGEDDAGDVRVVELDDHPFFLATLFQPERRSLDGALHPIVAAFFDAAAGAAPR